MDLQAAVRSAPPEARPVSDYARLSARPWLAKQELERVWKTAAQFDRSLDPRPRTLGRLAAKRVVPCKFSRAELFRRMSLNEPVLFADFPVRPNFDHGRLSEAGLLDALRTGFPRALRARVRTAGSINYKPVPAVLDKWTARRSSFGVTDLHYIGTRFDSRIDTSGLNDFNLLPRGTDGYESQDSLVVSTTGGFTDSHSDDHSGSNHSFTGTKVWLLWDIFEGFAHGLEDVERCTVHDQAAFDLGEFLSMRSSRWIFIGPGQTMFIPANLTHKVITLEPYLGLGSFHVGLPGMPSLLSHWARLPPYWSAPFRAGERGSVEFLTQRAIRKIREVRTAGRSEQYRWGLPQMKAALRRITAKNFPDPRWTEAGRANIEAFVAAASRA